MPAAGLVALTVLGLAGCESRDSRPAIDPLDTPALVNASESLFKSARESRPNSEPAPDTIPPRDRLTQVIESGGEALKASALIAAFEHEGQTEELDARRLRAHLALQVLPPPSDMVQAWLASPDPQRWAWAMLSEQGFPDLDAPEDVSADLDAAQARQLLDALGSKIEESAGHSAIELEGYKAEYADDYRMRIAPQLRLSGTSAEHVIARSADLNGDGVADHGIYASLDTLYWQAYRFFVVINGATGESLAAIRLESGESVSRIEAWRFKTGEYPRLVVHGDIVGGWSWKTLRIIGSELGESVSMRGRTVVGLVDPVDSSVWFAKGHAFNAHGGKAAYLEHAFGSAFQVMRFDRSGNVSDSFNVYTSVDLW